MELFPKHIYKEKNHLPYDGRVHYFGQLWDKSTADYYYNKLLTTIDWQHDVANMFGKRIVTKRKVAWHGEKAFPYTYSNNTKYALPWTTELIELKSIIEKSSRESYNSCLLNLYHDGSEGMAWHSDGEKDLKKDGAIASVSFGAERKFAFKHKESKKQCH